MKPISRSRIFPILLAVTVVFFCCISGAICHEATRFCRADANLTYYFLVRECGEERAAAVAGQVYGAGGAGVRTEEGVAVACYFSLADAERVRSSLSERGEEVLVKPRSVPALVFYGDRRKSAEEVLTLLISADSCARTVYFVANGLERGTMDQAGARSLLEAAVSSLSALAGGGGPKWDEGVSSLCEEGEEAARGILFSKDVRRLQTKLCRFLLTADEIFAETACKFPLLRI